VSEQHTVAVVVFVTAEGQDRLDARNVAELAVHAAITPGTVLHSPNRAGTPDRLVTIEDVLDVERAALNGRLVVGPRPARS
jgi:hypothetical protein